MICSPCDLLTIVMASTLMCGEPPQLLQGSFEGPETPTTGSLYNYTCDLGFAFGGNYTDNLQAECLESGGYSITEDEFPVCEEGCPKPADIDNGAYNETLQSIYQYGDNVTYHCLDGYHSLNDSSMLECSAESWNPEPRCLAECPEPPAVPFSTHNVTNTIKNGTCVTGTELIFACDGAHALKADQDSTIICGEDGNWTTDIPICYPICEVSPEIENGQKMQVRNTTLENGTVTEMEVDYSCDPDYTLYPEDAVTTLVCHPGPHWHPASPPSCLAECPPIPEVTYGNVSVIHEMITGRLLSGTVIEYECDDLHTFINRDSTLVCEEDGTWNSTATPQCLRECPALNVTEGLILEEVKSVYPGSFANGTIYNISCGELCEMSDPSLDTTECTPEGTWTSPLPYCFPVCPDIEETEGMNLTMTNDVRNGSNVEGTSYNISCQENYAISDYRLSTIECDAELNWTNAFPSCVRDCGVANEITYGNKTVVSSINATTESGIQNFEQEIEYSCHPHYWLRPDGYENVVCGQDGSFEPGFPYCERIDCGIAPTVQNAGARITKDIDSGLHVVGTELTYTCAEGYIWAPQDEATVVCQTDGHFSPVRGACYRICEDLPEAENVTRSLTTVTVNSTYEVIRSVTWTCEEPYTLLPDDPTWTCQNAGNWTYSVEPACLIACPKPNVVRHAYLNIMNRDAYLGLYGYLPGSRINYTCEEYYTIQSNYTEPIECLEGGEWSVPDVDACQLEWSDYRQCNASYEYFTTLEFKNYDDARQDCVDAGADLMHDGFGLDRVIGDKYFSEIKTVVTNDKYNNASWIGLETLYDQGEAKHLWIGLNDIAAEGEYEFVDGTSANLWTYDEPLVFGWANNEPNNFGNEDCILIYDAERMNDAKCHALKRGLCERKNITCVYP